MDQSCLVDVLQSRSGLADVFGGLRHGQGPFFVNNLLQGPALDVFHDHVMKLVGLMDFISMDDVRMVEGGAGTGLAVEALEHGVVVRHRLGQDLDCHAERHKPVFAQIHTAHAPGAEPIENVVGADLKTSALALQKLIGLPARQKAFADQRPGQAGRILRGGRRSK